MNTYTKAALLFFAFIFISCDKDFNTLGSDIVGDEHFNFTEYFAENLNAYVEGTGPVQTNNLALNSLGIYKNPVFGTTKAHFVSQIEMGTPNPDIGYNHYIDPSKDSVYVYIPFFSTLESTETDGSRTFSIDSLYGDSQAKFNLKVYENGYFLRDFDPDNNNQTQKYYSDFKPTIDTYKGSQLLNIGSVSENTEFFFNKNEIVIYKTNDNGQFYNSSGDLTTDPSQYVVKERKDPGIWLNLHKEIFKTKILDAVALGKLYNNNTFKQHFKGLYFEVEELIAGQGSLVKLDFTKAEIVVQYHSYSSNDTNAANLSKRTLNFQMGYSATGSKKSNTINLLELSPVETNYSNALQVGASQEKLYLKGGANGSVAYIDVFNDVELQTLRDNNWLINEANLVFYVDQSEMSAAEYEPLRIYLFDATNNIPLLDYYTDASTVASSPSFNKFVYGGIIEKSSDGKGFRYKIRITDYINNVLNGTTPSTNGNSRLGLVVTESINVTANVSLKPATPSDDPVLIPVASVLNPLGTVLYGTQTTDLTKKLKLQIYYTEPN